MRTLLRCAPAIAVLVLAPGCKDDEVPRRPVVDLSDGATKVSVIADLRVALDGDVDPASVTADTVRLTTVNWNGPDVHPASVRWDAAGHFVSVVPARPLAYGRRYVLEVRAALRDGGVVHRDLSFRTFVNPVVEVRADGMTTAKYFYDADGRLTDVSTVSGHSTYAYEDGRVLIRSYRKLNGDLGSVFDGHREVRVDGRGAPTIELAYANVGADDVPFTGDDVVQSWTRTTYDAQGDWSDEVTFDAPGPDGVWLTDDDVANWWVHVDRDADGVGTRWIQMAPGTDGVFFTDDDGPSFVQTMEWDAVGRIARVADYTRPGADGVWLTADDHLRCWNSYAYDAFGLEREWVNHWVDGAPERVRDRTKTSYDGEGNRVREVRELASGGAPLSDRSFDTTF